MKRFDIDNWYRKVQFDFFKSYDDPFFNITANLRVGKLYDYCKSNNLSFFLSYMYVALKATNEIQEFRLRLKGGSVYEFDRVYFGSTILNDDKSFSICYFDDATNMLEFVQNGGEVIAKHKSGGEFKTRENNLDVIHCTTIPWLPITGFKHARRGDEKGKGIPKLVFGKMFDEGGLKKMPLSVEAHHALMDGYHVALLFENMQKTIDSL